MKRALIVLLACLVGAATLFDAARAIQSSGAFAQVQDPTAANPPAAPPRTGKVIETMDAGRYTYVRVDHGEEKIWAAAPKFEVKVGDSVLVPEGIAMTNHYSKTLDRSFEEVYFVAFVAVVGENGELRIPRGHGDAPEEDRAREADLSPIERAEGGKTVAELFDERSTLAGREVTVRGRVVKVTSGVMGKNWIHLKDGTAGAGGFDDLTVTCDEIVEVGDTVLVRGVVSIDRDFGFGYEYDLIIEDADVAVE